jgi:hypothetical protein
MRNQLYRLGDGILIWNLVTDVNQATFLSQLRVQGKDICHQNSKDVVSTKFYYLGVQLLFVCCYFSYIKLTSLLDKIAS